MHFIEFSVSNHLKYIQISSSSESEIIKHLNDLKMIYFQKKIDDQNTHQFVNLDVTD